MPYHVVYAPEASDQLEALYIYIADRSSPAVAQRYTDAVVQTCEGLALFPLRGVAREDIRPARAVDRWLDISKGAAGNSTLTSAARHRACRVTGVTIWRARNEWSAAERTKRRPFVNRASFTYP